MSNNKISTSLNSLEVFAFQKSSIGGNLSLQLHLHVEENFILLRLLLDVVTQLHQLSLQLQGDGIKVLDFHVVAHLCFPQCALQ